MKSHFRRFACCCRSGSRLDVLCGVWVKFLSESKVEEVVNVWAVDEFDVFMDAVNRRISMKMMVR